MKLIFVHGWSVTHTNTYGDLPESIAARAAARGLQIDIAHIYLGKYISFDDEVTVDDIARALNFALGELAGNGDVIQPFSCITHSTGGPIVRHWVEKYYGSSGLSNLPLNHLVMLAPANHGSSLAILGKERVGRLKAWFSGVEPGQRVLDWLCLGSEGQWTLNEAYLRYAPARHGFYPFVLSGQGIDTSFYDFLNSYLVENGSDGVVRVAGANMNYRYLALKQTSEPIEPRSRIMKLSYTKNRPVRFSRNIPLGVFHNFSHSGGKMGIMAVKAKRDSHHLIVSEVLDCLAVDSADAYADRATQLRAFTEEEQRKKPMGKKGTVGRYSMLVFRISDHLGNVIEADDFDIYLLGGPRYKKDQLPDGFFVDRQMNKKSNSLVYYINADTMARLKEGLYGIRVVVRPEKGFSYYMQGEFRSEGIPVDKVFAPNETTYIDVTVNRQVDKNVFGFSPASSGRESFKNTKPSGEPTT